MERGGHDRAEGQQQSMGTGNRAIRDRYQSMGTIGTILRLHLADLDDTQNAAHYTTANHGTAAQGKVNVGDLLDYKGHTRQGDTTDPVRQQTRRTTVRLT